MKRKQSGEQPESLFTEALQSLIHEVTRHEEPDEPDTVILKKKSGLKPTRR